MDFDYENDINDSYITPPLIIEEYKGLPLRGLCIVFSGDKKLTNKAKKLGAIVDDGIHKRTNLLVIDHIGTMNNKEKECIKKGIKIMSLEEFKLKF